MISFDMKYLSSNLASLCGVPVRLMENNIITFFTSAQHFPKDPVLLEIKEIINSNKKIGFIITKEFLYYSYLKVNQISIVVGPHCQIKPDITDINKLAMDLELSKEETQEFVSSMNCISSIPLESVIQSLCMFNYVFTKEKLHIKDILIDSKTTERFDYSMQKKKLENQVDGFAADNNAYSIENEICSLIEQGDLKGLEEWINTAPAVNSGILSRNYLRQIKNTFICAATVFSRAAIKGMLDSKESLQLSDLYIQKMELLQSPNEISTLQMNMALDFAKRVSMIKGENNISILLINLNKYIFKHISEAIKIDNICKELFISKSSLFEQVKKGTSMTVSEYILNYKIKEAKNLLKYTNKTLSSISIYLGFSSQSHFTRTFKDIEHLTPIEYRKKFIIQ